VPKIDTRILAVEVDYPPLALIGVDAVKDDIVTLPDQQGLQKVPVKLGGSR
jgi:hypothetical protein